VSIEPSGWGTKVTLTAQLEGAEPAEEPSAEVPVEAARRRGFIAWLFRARASSQETLEEPQVVEEPSQDPSALDPDHAQSVLDETLEALGSAHHRPFSRG
jgi:hypothetical protein